jgi:hypothetical protein
MAAYPYIPTSRQDLIDSSIVTRMDNGTYTAVDIDVVKRRIDQVWDNAFRY